jgi:hypothetical protein
MPARLNRRRYREIVAALKELIADQKAPQQRRLHAIETLMEVYARHDRTEADKARRKTAESQVAVTDAPTVLAQPLSREDALEAAKKFLFSRGKESTNVAT